MELCCEILHVSRTAYYAWLAGNPCERRRENEEIAKVIEKIYEEDTSKGYRRIKDDLSRYHNIHVNDKRVLRICRVKGIKSTIKYRNPGCTTNASNPQHIAENLLNRKFHAEAPDQKWLTDVTEFKWYEGIIVHKIYLSAILDLYDRRIVAFKISDHNNNSLVFDTFNQAIEENPKAHPLFHSDRGFQYTSATFHGMLEKAKMKQSMSRVGKCIDNGPMEGFWGMLKRERYYGKRFTSKANLVKMIEDYIVYYNTRRLQRKLRLSIKVYFHHRRVCICEAFPLEGHPSGTSFASELVGFLEQGGRKLG